MNIIPLRGLRADGAELASTEMVEVDVLDLLAGPTDAELNAIEAEWPQIAADLDQLDAELLILDRPATELDNRRIRRARRRAVTARATVSGGRLAAFSFGAVA